jgi:hypothetical protein
MMKHSILEVVTVSQSRFLRQDVQHSKLQLEQSFQTSLLHNIYLEKFLGSKEETKLHFLWEMHVEKLMEYENDGFTSFTPGKRTYCMSKVSCSFMPTETDLSIEQSSENNHFQSLPPDFTISIRQYTVYFLTKYMYMHTNMLRNTTGVDGMYVKD